MAYYGAYGYQPQYPPYGGGHYFPGGLPPRAHRGMMDNVVMPAPGQYYPDHVMPRPPQHAVAAHAPNVPSRAAPSPHTPSRTAPAPSGGAPSSVVAPAVLPASTRSAHATSPTEDYVRMTENENRGKQRDAIATPVEVRGILTNEEIRQVERLVEKEVPSFDGNAGGEVDANYRSSTIAFIPRTPATEWLYRALLDVVKQLNDTDWHFDLTEKATIQYAQYDASTNGHYDWHLDIGVAECSRRKLSVSVQLTDPAEYAGGELEMLMAKTAHVAVKEKGSAIIFPSFLLHRVTPVREGTRKALVMWVDGEPFR